MTRIEQFIAACTTLPFIEESDDRDESSIPEISRMSAMLDNGMFEEAIEYGIGLIKHFPDNDVLPTIVGTMLIQLNRSDEVDNLIRDALPNCRRKYRLYSMAGQASFARNRLAEALVWWSRSAVAQCQNAEYQTATPFFNLAHAALVIGSMDAARSMLTLSRAIDPDKPRLSTTLQDLMEPLRYQWFAEAIAQVLVHIDTTYLRRG